MEKVYRDQKAMGVMGPENKEAGCSYATQQFLEDTFIPSARKESSVGRWGQVFRPH